MKHLHYVKPNRINKLHDELIANVPSVANVLVDGVSTATMQVQGVGNDIYLDVPDNADEPAIAAVVAVHVPIPYGPSEAQAAFTGESAGGDSLAKAILLVSLDEYNRVRGWLGKPLITVENLKTAIRAKMAKT